MQRAMRLTCGWRSANRPGEWLLVSSAVRVSLRVVIYGGASRHFLSKVFALPISRMLVKRSSPMNTIKQLAKTRDLPLISSGSTTPSDNGLLGSSVGLCLSPSLTRCISFVYTSSFTATTLNVKLSFVTEPLPMLLLNGCHLQLFRLARSDGEFLGQGVACNVGKGPGGRSDVS